MLPSEFHAEALPDTSTGAGWALQQQHRTAEALRTPRLNGAPDLIVGVVGGTEALRALLAATPVGSRIGFVLLPTGDSPIALTEPLRPGATAIPLYPAADAMGIRAGAACLIPPRTRFRVRRGHLWRAKPDGSRCGEGSGGGLDSVADLRTPDPLPHDLFLTSLARDQGARAVGIVLDGGGADAALGLRAIRRHGGLTLAQHPAASPDSTPPDGSGASAGPAGRAGTTLPDAVLPIAAMPACLLRYAQGLGEHGPAVTQALPEAVLPVLRDRTGHDFSLYRTAALTDGLRRRMDITGLAQPEHYLARLDSDPEEAARLAEDVLLRSSSTASGAHRLQRDPAGFAALRQALPALLAAGDAAAPFRAWVPGCGSGEEVHALAALLQESMAESGIRREVRLFGSDSDATDIAIARAGCYHASRLPAAPSRSYSARYYPGRWFVESGGMLQATPELRQMCVFSTHDLLRDPPFARMHLISCHNLLAQVLPSLQERLLKLFRHALVADGLLFLGPADGIGRVVPLLAPLLVPLDRRHRILRRTGPTGRLAAPGIAPAPPEDWVARAAARAMTPYGPPYLVVDASHRIVLLPGGRMSRYLDPAILPAGDGHAAPALFARLRPALHAPVRLALRQAQHGGAAAREPALLTEATGAPLALDILVVPLLAPRRAVPAPTAPFAISPVPTTPDAAPETQAAAATTAPKAGYFLIACIEAGAASAELPAAGPIPPPAVIAGLNEELRLALEEHRAINEELRAANEELEVAREEMQSVNEELLTVNAELLSRNQSLVRLNTDVRNLLDSTQIGTLFLDRALRIKGFTPAATELFALREQDTGRPITDLSSRLDYSSLEADVARALHAGGVVERELRCRSDPPRVLLMRMRPYRRSDDSIDGVVITFIDITDRKRAEDQVWFLAHHDPLTGLANRAMFHALMERDAAPASASADVCLPAAGGRTAALLYLDLDRFKHVNDTFGHRVGDKLLQEVAARLRQCVGEGDTVCRLGGDEFAVVQSQLRQRQDAVATAARILADVAAPYEIEGQPVRIGVSVGVAFRTPGETDPEALPRAADMALYDAKANGRGNVAVFRPELQRLQLERLGLEADLRQAILRDEFVLLYQPLVRLSDQRIVGAEALLRWRHPRRGLLSPAGFVGIAEETGLIVPLGAWVLRHACAEAAQWPAGVGLSVNLSSAQFASRELVATVRGALGGAGLAAGRLGLEVTETVLLLDGLRTQATLAALREAGVSIAMDDFGTGYSSLSYLRNFAIHKIKIDQSFTQTVTTRRESSVIVAAVVAIGQGLDIEVCAEGVETPAQLEALRRLGVQEGQGFGLWPPLGAAEFRAALGEQK